MHLTPLLDVMGEAPQISALVEAARAGEKRDVTVSVGARLPLIAELSRSTDRPLVIVTATGRETDELAAGLEHFVDPGAIATFPAWETLPHERLSPRSDTVARRLASLRRLAHPGDTPVKILIMPVRSLLQPIPVGLGDLEPVTAQMGMRIQMEEFTAALVDAAYTRVDMVTRRGEFAVRGGLIDVFAPTEPHPHRIEFFGDEIDEIRYFSAADQRSLEIAEHGVWAPPCREILLTDAVRKRAGGLVEALPGAAEMLEKLAEGIAVEGMESLAPVLVESMEAVVAHFPQNSLIILDDPERLRRRSHDLVATTEEFLAAAWSSAAAGADAPVDLASAENLGLSAGSFATLESVEELARDEGFGWWTFGSLPTDQELAEFAEVPGSEDAGETRTLQTRDVRGYRGKIDEAVADLKNLTTQGWRLVLVTEGVGPARRLTDQLLQEEVPARLVTEIAPAGADAREGEDPSLPPAGIVLVTTAQIRKGFVSEPLKFALFTEADLTGREGPSTRDMRTLPSRRRGVVDPLALKAIGSVSLKANEPGLRQLAHRCRVPFETFSAEALREHEHRFPASSFVRETVGVGSVSGPVAWLLSQGNLSGETLREQGVTITLGVTH